MKPELEELLITAKTLEKLTGYEISDSFIGGIGGVFRASRSQKRMLGLIFAELAIFLITFIFSIPFGFLTIRDRTDAIDDSASIVQFLIVPLAIAFVALIGWNIYMIFKAKSLKTLMNLLDEVDKYNEVIQAVDLLDKLEATGMQTSTAEPQTLKALNLTRNSIVCGLMAEKILRENRHFLARRNELCANIENYIVTLRNMEVQNQARDSAQIIRDALQIGVSVQQEVQKL